MPKEYAYPLFNLRHSMQSPVKISDIFLAMVPMTFIATIVADMLTEDSNCFKVDKKHYVKAIPSINNIYKILAIKTRIFGLQPKPKESERDGNVCYYTELPSCLPFY